MAPTRERCHFLELPPELRNRIYSEGIASEPTVQIADTGYTRPGFLATCKKVRHEALLLWYESADFNVHFADFSSDACFKFTDNFNQLAASSANAIFFYSVHLAPDMPNWANLSTWLCRYHAQDTAADFAIPPASDVPGLSQAAVEITVLAAMFKQVERMRCCPWALVEEVVEAQRDVLVRFEGGWASGG